MASVPCIEVPSPQEIRAKLFPDGTKSPSSLPGVWNAQALLTPFGGLTNSPISPSDQLVIANITYDANVPGELHMRVNLYLLETLQYYDFFFRTSNGATQWWWLTSNPADPNGLPTKTLGPFTTAARVPGQTFLTQDHFSHAGTWSVLGSPCNAFSGRRVVQPGTWYWFDTSSGDPARIMNVDISNDFQIAVLGAYYLANFSSVKRLASSRLSDVYSLCSKNTQNLQSPSPMLTLSDLQTTMAKPPLGVQVRCTLQDIQALMPGISHSQGQIPPPSWTNQIQSVCFMVGQDTYPYYCQVWYDWDRGAQVTVFVQQGTGGSYDVRFDEYLPKGAVGPAIVYSWNGSHWALECCQPDGSVVPMPVPNFVEAGQGKCRALFAQNPQLGSLSIWSVMLGDSSAWSNFWYWFSNRQEGMIFSLAPARSLTMIDYQTFIQNAVIDACVFENPCSALPPCSAAQTKAREKARFVPLLR